MAGRLTILFTNIWLAGYAGSEAVVRDLALGSLRRGHRPIVYSPTLGSVSEELSAKGVAVLDDLRMLAEAPDIIHAHHAIPCGEALIRFPGVPAINVCHAFDHWVEAPVHFPQIGAYVTVDEACRDRLVHAHGIDPTRVVLLPNAVDLNRVPPRPHPLPDRPRRALAFGKASAVAQARIACETLAIDFEAIGDAVKRQVSQPEQELVRFDLVFASARAALEALCCGCAVIVCDERGIAGPVTAENFSMLRAMNFGLRSLVAPITVDRLIGDIRGYDRADATAVCARARREADLETLLDAFDRLYVEVLSGARRPSVPKGAQEAAVARFLHDYLPRRPGDPRWPWLGEREALHDRIRQLEIQHANALQQEEALRERGTRLESQLTAAEGEREVLRERHMRTENQLSEAAREREILGERVRQLQHQLADTTQAFDAIKRSRLLRFGRWLRRIRGLPVPY